jgi:hypothetical protein
MIPSAAALRRAPSLVALVCLVLSSACGDPAGPNGVASVRISGMPESGQIFDGYFVFLFADLYDSDGKPVAGARNFLDGIPVTWTISDPNIALLEASRWQAAVTAFEPGSVFITASADGKRATVRLNVVPVPIGSVSISPATAEIHVGETTQLRAVVVDSLGAERFDQPVTWTSSDAGRAGVGSDGLVSGVAAGTATITAAVRGKSGTAAISVLGP